MNNTNSYAIIEDAPDVCEGIKARMDLHDHWRCEAIIYDIDTAKSEIKKYQPELLFMDWSIKGGSTFELLDYLSVVLPNYKPYIVYFTAFQKDEPEIPMLIVNKYKPDAYLIKPIWEYLSNNLSNFLEEAKMKAKNNADFILRTINKQVVYIKLNEICSISICNSKLRTKIIYLIDGSNYEFKDFTLDEFSALLSSNQVNHFRANKRENSVPKTICIFS
jgi:two-component system, LytTR family, response regulator